EGARACRRALPYARLAHDVFTEGLAMVHVASGALFGPDPLPRAVDAAKELLAWSRASSVLWTEGIALAMLARLEAMAGGFDEGRRLFASSLATLAEVGYPQDPAEVPLWTGLMEWL